MTNKTNCICDVCNKDITFRANTMDSPSHYMRFCLSIELNQHTAYGLPLDSKPEVTTQMHFCGRECTLAYFEKMDGMDQSAMKEWE